MSQFAATLDLADLDGTNGYRLYGTFNYGYAGFAVSSADINGDGFTDVIVGAPYSGNVYVVFGGDASLAGFDLEDTVADGTIQLDPSVFDGTNGFMISSGVPFLGISVSGAGDTNGDDIGDFVIGGAGFQLILFGTDGPIDPIYDDGDIEDVLDDGEGYVVTGPGGFGQSSSAGDINNDGFEDFIFGMPDFGGGVAWVVLGGLTNLSALDLADGDEDGQIDVDEVDGTTGFAIFGGEESLGFSVAATGDVNGDGFDDILVGDYLYNAMYLVFGSATPAGAALDIADLDGTNGYVFAAPAGGVGVALSAAGDVNADGNADMIVGVPGGGSDGAAFVLFGGAGKLANFDAEDGTVDGLIDLIFAGPDYGFGLLGQNDGAAGLSVSSAGDVNGDGFDDILVGAPYASGYTGEAYVVFGAAGGFAPDFSAEDLDGNNGFVITGEALGDVAGWDVSAAGDVNGDGFADIIVGAYYSYGGANAGGAAYIIYGHMPDEEVNRDGTKIANTIHGGDFKDLLDGKQGADILIGHAGVDRIKGGKGNDTLIGGEHGDRMGGNQGADTFVYEAVTESNHTATDTIFRFDATEDLLDLWFTVTGVHAPVVSSIGHLEDNLGAGELGANHAVLVTTNHGATYLVVDANGTAGYQDDADLLIRLKNPDSLDFDTGDFI